MRAFASRAVPRDRQPQEVDQTSYQEKTFLPPVSGMVTNALLAAQDERSARYMANFLPDRERVRPREGCAHVMTLPSRVEKIFSHRGGSQEWRFAANATGIYLFDNTTQPATPLNAVVTGQTSGDYSVLSNSTDDIAYLTVVNGVDAPKLFDGTSWTNANLSGTGLTIARLSHVWGYRNRQFYVEKGTLNAWYLATNAVQGALSKLPLSGVFNRGGALLTGARWSSDSGDGIDDRCVFITDQGEFAVFTGSNPALASNWSLVGVYELGVPLDKNAMFLVGGDLIVATRAGLIPLSSAIQKTPEQLKLDALSNPIEDDWRREVLVHGTFPRWSLAKWDTRNIVVVSPPQSVGTDQQQFAINTETGAWSLLKGWDVTAMGVLSDRFFFGGPDGKIYEGFVGGSDDGKAIVSEMEFAPSHFSAPGRVKLPSLIQTWFRHNQNFNAQAGLLFDYNNSLPSPPIPATLTASVALWDEAIWDVASWGTSSQVNQSRSLDQVVTGQGEVMAPYLQLTSNSADALDAELTSLRVVYEVGGVVD